MTKFKSIMILSGFLAVAAVESSAQTNTPSSSPTNSVLADLGRLGSDAWAALSTLDFSSGIKATPFFMVHEAPKQTDFGGGLAVSTAMTNGVNYGFAVAALTDSSNPRKRTVSFYDATLSLNVGHMFTLGQSVALYPYLETGPATDLSNPTVLYVQSFSGIELYIGQSRRFSLGAGIGNCTKWSQDILGVGHFSWTF